MTGEEALKEIQKLITDAIETGKKPVKVLIPSEYENALITIKSDVIGSDLKEKIATIGVKAAFPKIVDVETVWDAEKLELQFEDDSVK